MHICMHCKVLHAVCPCHLAVGRALLCREVLRKKHLSALRIWLHDTPPSIRFELASGDVCKEGPIHRTISNFVSLLAESTTNLPHTPTLTTTHTHTCRPSCRRTSASSTPSRPRPTSRPRWPVRWDNQSRIDVGRRNGYYVGKVESRGFCACIAAHPICKWMGHPHDTEPCTSECQFMHSYTRPRHVGINSRQSDQVPCGKFAVVHAARRHKDDPRTTWVSGSAPQVCLCREEKFQNQDHDIVTNRTSTKIKHSQQVKITRHYLSKLTMPTLLPAASARVRSFRRANGRRRSSRSPQRCD